MLIPDYELVRRIGSGAYGEVWLARSVATGALRAAKIVWRHTFEDERPFQREFEGIQKFERLSREHPSQLALFHIGRNEAAGYFYYVMELADGWENPKPETRNPKEGRSPRSEGGSGDEAVRLSARGLPSALDPRPSEFYSPHTLRADLAQGRLPANRVLEIGLALAEALDHLHRHGLVHRDVKPSNVIFVNGRPKLADIGLVTDVSDRCSIVGTEGYLPPEGPGTPQADVFALGKLLYEALTGMDRREFPRLPEDLRSWPDARLVFELNEVLLKACAADPQARYAGLEALLADLQRLQQGKSVKQHWAWQQRWAVSKRVGGVLAFVALVMAGAVILSRRPPALLGADGPDSTNDEAQALCTKAMLIIRGDNYAEFTEAYTNFHRAIELDPHFARPYVGLLELRARENLPTLGLMSTQELLEIGRKLAQLSPNSAPACCAQSIVEFYDWHFPQADEWVRKAIRADPNYELAHTWYGFMLTDWGRPADARKHIDMSRKLLPSKATIYRLLGHVYYAERDFPHAIAQYQEALKWEPHHSFAFNHIGKAYLALNDYSNAIASFRAGARLERSNASDVERRFDDLLRAFAEGGPRGYWEERWRAVEGNPRSSFYGKAMVRIRLGDPDGALAWLRKSFQAHEHEGYQTPLVYLLFDDCWDGLRQNPEFKRLLEDVGFTRMMPAAGS